MLVPRTLGEHAQRRKGPLPARGRAAKRVGERSRANHGQDGEAMDDILEDDGGREQYRVTASELRQFIERFERLEAEKKDIADQQKEVLAEARARGYDVKVIRKLIALRRREPQEVSEEEAVLQLYKEALGMA
jgi:uncharacterized protein (UPF0335 family)